VIEPLRAEWSDVKAAALLHITEAEPARERGLDAGGRKSPAERLKQSNIELRKARNLILGFHKRLCNVRVLDPACGTGNFLYVALEHLKRLEGEVLNALDEFGLSSLGITAQTDIDMEASRVIAEEAETVDPHQLLGIEVNPRAAAIAEVVLWIGYLQWHFRTRGDVNPPQPVVRDFRNIENRDAVLAYDKVEYVTDARGVPVTRWDGKTYKPSPVTGEPVPDEAARTPLERYVNPRKAAWPKADFVVGNPPFIGASNVRRELGDGYADALRAVWSAVPESSDFVMHWWHHAAVLTARGALQRFGFITTNSIRQTFNRRVVETALLNKTSASLLPPGEGARRADEGTSKSKRRTAPEPSSGAARHPLPEGVGKAEPLSLAFAIPDHPWVDTADGAAVRIAMTTGIAGVHAGRLLTIESEADTGRDEIAVTFRERPGMIHADLSIGADVAGAKALLSNATLCCPGFKLHGAGFIVTPEQAHDLGLGSVTGLEQRVRAYRNGRDLTDTPRGVLVIDLFGLEADDVRRKFPAVYQHVLERVKPERDQNQRASYRENWCVFGEPRRELRKALKGLPRYIATVETAKHRTFQFLDANIAPDNRLVCIALDDARFLGVLSSSVHATWALKAGGTLEDRPVYNKTRCFDPFPFPAASDAVEPSPSRGGRRAAPSGDGFHPTRSST
ncbi:MAG: class I SAM-dependent DNA methyltransferase, partial [Rhodanobacteraceae bacterium]